MGSSLVLHKVVFALLHLTPNLYNDWPTPGLLALNWYDLDSRLAGVMLNEYSSMERLLLMSKNSELHSILQKRFVVANMLNVTLST